MKHLIYNLIIIFSLTSMMSCKKFLDIKPQNAVSDENTIFDKASAETALNGAYRQLGSQGYYGENFVTLGFFPSGDVQNNTTGGAANLVNVNFRSDDLSFNTSWTAIYAAINRANNIIEKVPGLPANALFTEDDKNKIIGEAKFIRALAYFDLSRGWGGVQLFLQPTVVLNDRPRIPRSSLEETHQQILKDLNEAEEVLPEEVNRIRATKNTVRALKARLFLYRKDWKSAEDHATMLINKNADFDIIKPFNSWFANNAIGTKESIFEVQYSAQNQSSLRAQMQHPTKGGTYRYAPNERFVNLLKDPATGGGRRALIDSVTQGTTVLWFGNLYYRNPATDPSYVLRMAEMYLIRAEARTHQENLPEALADLNAIRERADLSELILGQDVSTAEDILAAIENERRFEFAWEGHRWFDLSRTGRAKTVLEALDPKTQVSEWEYLFPIPITQVQLDPQLSQNPGY